MKKFWFVVATCASVFTACVYGEEESHGVIVLQEIAEAHEMDVAGDLLENPKEQTIEKPRIETFFILAEHVDDVPKLKPLLQFDPGFNKTIFRLKGFPVDKEIIWEEKRLASLKPSAFEKVMSFTIQPNGSMVKTGGTQMKALLASSRGYLPGERVTYRFRTEDNSVSEEVTMYPQPIIARNKEGNVTLRAELTSIIPTVYLIELPTMEEGEEYEFKSMSVGETLKSKVKYSKTTPMHYTPEVEGHTKGSTSRLEIKRKSGELIIVTFPWGTLLKSYLSGDLSYP